MNYILLISIELIFLRLILYIIFTKNHAKDFLLNLKKFPATYLFCYKTPRGFSKVFCINYNRKTNINQAIILYTYQNIANIYRPFHITYYIIQTLVRHTLLIFIIIIHILIRLLLNVTPLLLTSCAIYWFVKRYYI